MGPGAATKDSLSSLDRCQSRYTPCMTAPSHPAGDVSSGGPVELGDHPTGRLQGPPGFLRSDRPGGLGGRGGGPAVKPLRVPPVSDHRVTEGLEPLEVGTGLKLASDGSLAQVVPLGEEPGPVVEAADDLAAQAVHH